MRCGFAAQLCECCELCILPKRILAACTYRTSPLTSTASQVVRIHPWVVLYSLTPKLELIGLIQRNWVETKSCVYSVCILSSRLFQDLLVSSEVLQPEPAAEELHVGIRWCLGLAMNSINDPFQVSSILLRFRHRPGSRMLEKSAALIEI